uniref:Uncharacterized protein n=1 Tax=mine drainage metagenome TaxID=410659 RepID=E6PXY5_9ZZZZ
MTTFLRTDIDAQDYQILCPPLRLMSDEACARRHGLARCGCRNLFKDFADAVCEIERACFDSRSLGLIACSYSEGTVAPGHQSKMQSYGFGLPPQPAGRQNARIQARSFVS